MSKLTKLIDMIKEGKDIFPSHFPDLFPKIPLAIRAFEGDLTAAKALSDALFPGWPVCTQDHSAEYLGGHGWNVRLNWPFSPYPSGIASYTPDNYRYEAWDDDPARAWLIVILRAYEVKND